MEEIPILFNPNPDMVKALLNGSKTQTRRVVKPQPLNELHNDSLFPRSIDSKLKNWNGETIEGQSREWKCPYGKVGDVLWVRETFRLTDFLHPSDENYGYIYKASENGKNWQESDPNWKWQPSIFMPYEACRIKLEITNIRVERLHDISESDAIAEGIEYSDRFFKDYTCNVKHFFDEPKKSYLSLWQKINGKESLDSNPFVWVIEFIRK
jgi:hypothetical protein